MEYKRESYVEELLSRRGNGFVKIITGLRRSGKSYLLNTLFLPKLKKELSVAKILQFAFDSEEDVMKLAPFLPEEPLYVKRGRLEYVNRHKFIALVNSVAPKDGSPFYLLLDEIQI